MSYPQRSGKPSALLVLSLGVNLTLALGLLCAVDALRPSPPDPIRAELRDCLEALLRHPEAFEAHSEGPGQPTAEERLRRRIVRLSEGGAE